MEIGTWAGLPLGDWATWAAAFFGFLAFVGLIMGLFVEGGRRRADIARLDAQRHQDQISAQAIQVGAFISWPAQTSDVAPDRERLQLTVINASPLPVRYVVGHIFRNVDDAYHARFLPIVIAPAGKETTTSLDVVRSAPGFRLELQFEDDAGQPWLKYGQPPLKLMTDEQWPGEPASSRLSSPNSRQGRRDRAGRRAR